MNRMKYLLATIVALVVMAGCGKKVDVAFSTSSVTVAPEGESVEVALTSNGDWSVAAYPEWLTVSPASGSGDATLTLTAPLNDGEAARSGEVRVTSKDNTATLTVTQEAMEKDYVIVSPTSIECEGDGGVFTLNVASNCDWRVNATVDWISCNPESGNGNGTVTVTIAPFESTNESRETNIIFSGAGSELLPIHVVQQAEIQIYVSLEPGTLGFEYDGGTQPFSVISNGNWTATLDVDWITMDATSGNGNADLTVTVAENETVLEAREGHVNFLTETGATATLIVKQEGAPDPHYLVITPALISFTQEGGEMELSVSCDMEWTATVQASWVSLSATTGQGDASLVLAVEPNFISEIRYTTLVFTSNGLMQQVAVNQEAGETPVLVSISPDTLYTSDGGGFEHLSITANTTWNLESSDAWVTLLTSSGTGDAEIDFVVDRNNSAEERIGAINIVHNNSLMGTMVIVQEGRPSILETDVDEIHARPEGGEYMVQVTANQSWTIETSVDWLVCIPASGTGDGEFMVKVNPLTAIQSRSTELRIYGEYGSYLVIPVIQSN